MKKFITFFLAMCLLSSAVVFCHISAFAVDSTSGSIINLAEEDSAISAVDLIGMDVDAAITLLRNDGHAITRFEDAVAIGKEQDVMLYYNEGSYGNYARGMIYQIITYGDFPITDTLRSGMTLLEVQNIAAQVGYATTLTEQEEYGMVYQLIVTGGNWQAEFIWSESYHDWDIGMNVLKENYDPNKSAADQVYVTKRNNTDCSHRWDSGTVTKASTCKDDGVKTYTCTSCGETKTENIPKLTTHSYKSEWSQDGTNHWHECSVCQNKKDLTAHTPGATATETTAQTCTVCGYVIQEALEGTQNSKVLKKVLAYSSTQEDAFWLQLLDVDGTAYILDIDATLVAPYDEVQFTPDGATYVYGKHTVKYTGNIETYNGGEYYDLQVLMDLLNVRYDYVTESQTIMFNAATSFKENLIEDCDGIYAGYCGLDYLDNPAYYGLGAAYNIIGGFRIDFLWGNYQTEMREEVVVNIMSADQNAESFVDLLNKGDSFAKKAMTVYKGLNDVTSGIERYSDLLDCPEVEWLKAYDKVSKGGGVFGFSDFLDIAQLAYDAQSAYSTYATAVKYGLVKNNNMKYVGDDCLKTASNNVYSYYEQETHVFSDMLADTVKTAGNNITTKAIKDIIKRGTGYKGNITKLVKLFADEVLQMKEMTTAVEHTHICATIQKATILQYKASNDPLTKKYCTILYLRACQYAYSLYAFDPDLKQFADDWNNKTQDAIEVLVKYSDAELSRTVKNDKLDMTHEGFVVISGVQN